MSREENTCDNFNQHAWKKDICTNCSKHLSCHNGRTIDKNICQREVRTCLNEQNDGSKQDRTSVTKSNKTRNSAFQKNILQNISHVMEPAVVARVTQDETNLDHMTSSCFSDQTRNSSNYYQIYDVTAKGQSGKPIGLDHHNNDSYTEGCKDLQNICLMATPYTVVDVITMALEKSRQSDQGASAPPCLPSTPAPDIKEPHSSMSTTAFEDEITEQFFDDQMDTNLSSRSHLHYHPRVYEEINDFFFNASKKCEMENESITKEGDKIISSNVTRTADHPINRTFEFNQKSIIKQDKSKKSGGKSFFQKLLGKSSRDEELCKNKADRNEKRELSLDDKNMVIGREVVGLSGSLPIDVRIQKEECNKGEMDGSGSMPEMLNQPTCIGEDFAKEIEEKFETLSRKSKSETSSDSYEKAQNVSIGVLSTLNGFTSTLPNRKSVLTCSTSKKDSSSNRKSMTPAEAKLARKMLVAPPPPPVCTSSTSLASVTGHSEQKDYMSNCIDITPASYFMSLQRQPILDQTHEITLHSSSNVAAESNINRNSLMDDLDEILMKGGITGNASTLPKSFSSNQDKMTGKHGAATDCPFPAQFNGSSNIVQQRALPELPQLLPSASRLHKINLSPDSENLYESLPHSEDLLSPCKENLVNRNSENFLNNLSVKTDENKKDGWSYKTDLTQKLDRPRPAPRAAIRTINSTKIKDANISLEEHQESYVNENKNRDKLGNSRLEETFEEKYSIVSELTLKSIHLFLEKFFSTSSLISIPMNLFSNVSWKQKEMEILKNVECKSPALVWKNAVFYEIETNDFNCILMVRAGSASTLPIPKYNHQNLINTLHTFDAHTKLPDCQRFFKSLAYEKDLKADKTKYIFDVLPYSKVLPFPSLSLQVPESSSSAGMIFPAHISKVKAHTLLQIFDSVVHLQRSGIDICRLHPSDILLVTPLESVNSSRDAQGDFLLPILVPLECDVNSPRSDQKLLCHDLSKITSFIISSFAGSSTECKKSEIFKRATVCHPCSQVPQPRARQISITLDKNDRCLRKVERILGIGDSWLQICTAINYLEFSIWGPSEEDIRSALTIPQRKGIFNWWIGSSRAELMVDLMQDPIVSWLLHQPMQISKTIHSSNNDQYSAEIVSLIKWQANLEIIRKAEFFKCDLERLLNIARGMFS